jgi:hypothetical protein
MTNPASRTRIDEIADGLYRIHTPVELAGAGGFSFNQYLVVDDEPSLFHTGPRKMFPLVREAVASVMSVERLRHVAFSHVEADECGSLNDWLRAAPRAAPLCGAVAALVSIGDLADRPPRALADGEVVMLGRHSVQWGCCGRWGSRWGPESRAPRPQTVALTRRNVAVIDVPPLRGSLCDVARSTSWLCSSSVLPVLPAASKAFIVGP